MYKSLINIKIVIIGSRHIKKLMKLSDQQYGKAVYLIGQGQIYPAQESFLEVEVINQLYEARDRLKNFASLIGYLTQTPIREDVITHCDKIKNLKNQPFSYEKVEKIVKYRIQKQRVSRCRIIKNKRIKKNWGQEDITILVWVISKYADYVGIRNVEKELNENNWNQISLLIPGVKADGCMFKWLGLKRNKLADHGWSQKESLTLDRLVRKYEDEWAKISEELYFTFKTANKVYRCPKQCREHWNCYLNPTLKKGLWQPEEDFLLLTEVRKRDGQKRWTELAKCLHGRTQNALKNRYNLIIEKQKGSRKNLKNLSAQQQLHLIDTYLSKNFPGRLSQILQATGRGIHFQPVKSCQIKVEDSNQRYSEKKIIKKRFKVEIGDSQSEQKSINAEYASNNYVFSTPKIFENHIIQMNSLDCTPPIFNSNYPKTIQQQAICQNRLNFQEDVKQQASGPQQEIRENGQLPVDVRKIHIISISENNMGMFTELVKNGENNGCSFVPCKINGDNKLTKLTY